MTGPDLGRLWETFVRVGQRTLCAPGRHSGYASNAGGTNDHRAPGEAPDRLVSFLIHGHSSGVPTHAAIRRLWHIRLELTGKHEVLAAALPANCEMTRYITRENSSRLRACPPQGFEPGRVEDHRRAERVVARQIGAGTRAMVARSAPSGLNFCGSVGWPPNPSEIRGRI